MKVTILFSLLFLTANIFGQQAYTINWAAAPLNPNPFAYTANHCGVFGKVKTINETSSTNSFYYYWEFDEKGVITKKIDSAELKKTYSCTNKYPKFIQLVVITEEKGLVTATQSFLSEINDNGVIEGIQVVDKKISNKRLSYKNGLLIEEANNMNEKVTYEYNTQGQLTKKTTFYERKIIDTETYSYINKNNTLIINRTFENKTYPALNYTQQETYNANGQLLEEKMKKAGNILSSSSYELDEQGNWIKRISATINYAEKKTQSETTFREIVYYN